MLAKRNPKDARAPYWELLWDNSEAWEKDCSNYFELLNDQPADAKVLFDRATRITETDPGAAVQLYVEAAKAGSVCSMEIAGWHYWTGTGVEADISVALDYYNRALVGGSWSATIPYARLLEEVGRIDESQRYLEACVSSGYVPAFFWLAWLRYLRNRSAAMRKEVRPLLEHAARQGHPAANVFLARWLVRGQLGLLNVPRGLLSVVRAAAGSVTRMPKSGSTGAG